eukprot:5596632-Pyramimonas_sp.AAC.1
MGWAQFTTASGDTSGRPQHGFQVEADMLSQKWHVSRTPGPNVVSLVDDRVAFGPIDAKKAPAGFEQFSAFHGLDLGRFPSETLRLSQ